MFASSLICQLTLSIHKKTLYETILSLYTILRSCEETNGTVNLCVVHCIVITLLSFLIQYRIPGSHGAGDEHETQTPYVIWGAGVKQTKEGSLDSQTHGMSLNHRIDVRQADLTPLMSTILSIPVPVNSIVSNTISFKFN